MAKSPVYSKGRNRKHRQKGKKTASPNHPAAANVNMRGKKEKIVNCRCCVCIDLRDKILYRIHKKEMSDDRDDT